jgi:hypothetical protein
MAAITGRCGILFCSSLQEDFCSKWFLFTALRGGTEDTHFVKIRKMYIKGHEPHRILIIRRLKEKGLCQYEGISQESGSKEKVTFNRLCAFFPKNVMEMRLCPHFCGHSHRWHVRLIFPTTGDVNFDYLVKGSTCLLYCEVTIVPVVVNKYLVGS